MGIKQSSQNNKRQSYSQDASTLSLSTSLSPLQPVSRTQSVSEKENIMPRDAERIDNVNSMPSFPRRAYHHDNRKQKLNFGNNGQALQEQYDQINKAMSNDQDWMMNTDELPSGTRPAYVADFLQNDDDAELMLKPDYSNNLNDDNNNTFVAASQTVSIPPTPNNRTFSFGRGFGRGFGNNDDILWGSVERNNHNTNNRNNHFDIPETPDNPGGSGASNIKSNCKNNKRKSIPSDDRVTKRLSFGANPTTGD